MAEDEILEETASSPKKGSGGGFSVGYLVLILAFVVIAAVAGIMIGNSRGQKLADEMKDQVRSVKQLVGATSENPFQLDDITCRPLMGTKEEPMPCDGTKDDCNVVVPLSDKPLIVSLADGEHFLSVNLSLCLVPLHKAEVFEKSGEKAMVLHVVNDFFASKTRADFFPNKAAAKPAAPAGGDDNMVQEFESDNSNQSFVQKKDKVRTELKSELLKRKIDFVDDVLITEFLVQ